MCCRLREGLKTLGVFDRVQACPETFCPIFCSTEDLMTAETLASLFTVRFSENKEQKAKEYMMLDFWKQYLHECEGLLFLIYFNPLKNSAFV